ncbi:ADP,ATP carrier protein 1 [Cucumispora dikerogammari]|nr:ADP,ATP carrier protein 1 [Cucumispora dikerogammari]
MTNSNLQPQQQILNEVEAEAQENGRKTYGLFPIASSEIPKLLCVAGLTFFLSFSYSSSRELKDSYFLEKMPSTSISFVKLLFVMPLNIFANLAISILLNSFSVETIFAGMTLFYTVFFALMGLFFIPYRNSLEMSIFTSIDMNSDGKVDFFGGLNGILPIFYLFGYWVVSINYCMIEIFSSTVFAYLMFTFFNYVCAQAQFRRFISLIFIFCNIAAVISGIALKKVKDFSGKMEYKNRQRLYYGYFLIVSLFCFLSFICQRIINSKYNQNTQQTVVKKKETPSMAEALKVLLSARVVLAFSVIVIFYNCLVNIIEMDYKSNLKRYQAEYLYGSVSMQDVTFGFQSFALITTGILVIIIMLSPLKNAILIFGWTSVGLVTPIFMLTGGGLILALSLINFSKSASTADSMTILAVRIGSFLGIKRTSVAETKGFMTTSLWITCITVSLFKCCKYAFFDNSKEAFSMLIDKENRAKYKSIYDGICGKLGKSFSSLYVIIWVNLISAKDVNEFSVVNVVTLVISSIVWCLLVFYIGSAYNTAIKSGKPMDLGISTKPEKKK